MNKSKKSKRIEILITNKLLINMEEHMKELGYPSRSEFIRNCIIKEIYGKEKQIGKKKNNSSLEFLNIDFN